ncbi:MAG: hypothetical protein K2N63_01515 [Lachnospiraceae bacterium]|nr:hypothetical protein [Lachnospiraceae bacterium]
MEEYAAFGITTSENPEDYCYYYQDNLVNILFDHRQGDTFYRISRNPEGTVNIKIIRDADNKITGVTYMTKAEVDKVVNEMMGFSLE